MLEFPLWKKLWLWGLTLAAAVLALPSLFNVSGLDWPAALPNPQVNLGLDLAGGSHLLLEARADDVRAQRLTNMEETVRQLMRNAKPRIRIGDVSTAGGQLSFMLENAGDIDRARGLIEPVFRNPPNLTRVEVCAASGDLPNVHCPMTATTWFVPGKSPIRVSDVHRAVMIDTRDPLEVGDDLDGTDDGTQITRGHDEARRGRLHELTSRDLA